jgi:hypothetical protein
MKVRRGTRAVVIPLAIFDKSQASKRSISTPVSNSFAGLDIFEEQLPGSAEQDFLEPEEGVTRGTLGEEAVGAPMTNDGSRAKS